MKILVTGSSGHLGEALMRTLRGTDHNAVGIDVLASSYTNEIGSVVDRTFVRRAMRGVDAVLHAATLHKPHVETHPPQMFVDTNITGTLNLLEEAASAGVRAFVFTSTTSAFGNALVPPKGKPAAWITEAVSPLPKNIYGVTKVAAENLCELFYRKHGLSCLVLRTSRFFPEEDDNEAVRLVYDHRNAKANEYLYRRVDIEDVVSAHLLAVQKAPEIGFGRYIISATSPFSPIDLGELRADAPAVLKRYIPRYEDVYGRLGWKMFPSLDRVYVNALARKELGWHPRHDYASLLERISSGGEFESPLAKLVGIKMYHRAGGKAA